KPRHAGQAARLARLHQRAGARFRAGPHRRNRRAGHGPRRHGARYGGRDRVCRWSRRGRDRRRRHPAPRDATPQAPRSGNTRGAGKPLLNPRPRRYMRGEPQEGRMNIFDKGFSPAEAELRYLDADYVVIKPGSFVRCAITGKPIALDELLYWNVDRQEAYADYETAHEAFVRNGLGRP